MPRIAEKLLREFDKAARSKIVSFAALAQGAKEAETLPSIEEMVNDGTHPTHAIYKSMCNLITLFVEQVVEFPFLHQAYKFLSRAQDIYTPGYPPMSPITLTHYTTWTSFDVPFGPDRETIGDCFLALAELFKLDPVQVEATRNLCLSTLGVYRVTKVDGRVFGLQELVTGGEIEAMIPTGFHAKPGVLILIRVLPPLSQLPSPYIGLTTPYVLAGFTESEWLEYLRRHEIIPGTVGVEQRLGRHMKTPADEWYWSEFVFYGYVNHRSDAIFLTGFPDRPETQPHHGKFNRSTITRRLIIEMNEALDKGG